MSMARIARCNPWSQGGVDYVDEYLDCADVLNSKKSEKEVVGAN
jgi:putative component of membrane protein insertase Oxa1/YidC/SpoIIIJ protein YidD